MNVRSSLGSDQRQQPPRLTRVLGQVGKGTGRAEVDGQVAAEGTLLFAVTDPGKTNAAAL